MCQSPAFLTSHACSDSFITRFLNLILDVKENPDNDLLGVRGNALTHEVELGRQTLEKLMKLNEGSTSELKVPRYDKSAFDGKGDRADEATWPTIKAPVDVVLFEGWMLGFTPVSDAAAEKVGLVDRRMKLLSAGGRIAVKCPFLSLDSPKQCSPIILSKWKIISAHQR